MAGPNYSYLRGGDFERTDEFKTEGKARFMASLGLSLKYQFNKVFLTTNLLYENKSSGASTIFYNTGTSGNAGREFSYKVNRQYLTIPVLVGVNIKNTGFFVNAGPYAGMLLKYKAFGEGQTTSVSTDEKSFDYGVSVGLGYSRAISSRLNVSGELRYSHSLYTTSTFSSVGKMGSTSLLFGVNYTLNGK